jgi:hypothetical protein
MLGALAATGFSSMVPHPRQGDMQAYPSAYSKADSDHIET